jgi:RND family efflux transporter MFP subunit
LWITGLVLALAAGAVVVDGVQGRRSQAADLRQRAEAQSLRTVNVVSPAGQSGAPVALDLPGRIDAWARAPIYARVAGYLKSWRADIGTPVKAGALLAEIETPEVDQQLLQAQAELATAKSNAALAASTAKRWEELLASGMVTRQGADEKTSDYAAKQSVVNALQANVDRLLTLKGFARLVAPFEGVVTARNTDVGALVSVGGSTSGSASGSELFVVSDTRKLRVYVSVPQAQVAALRIGSTARLTVPDRPGSVYAATVQSMARAITAASGGMLVQLTVENAAGELLPGGFASVSFDLPRGTASTLTVPPSALIFDKSGLRVATVGEGDKVVMKRVTVARDLGTSIELAGGLEPTDRVIESPPDGVENGDVVRVAAAKGERPKP